MNDSIMAGSVVKRWPSVAAAVAAPLPSESKGPREIQTTVLSNGLRIVTEAMPSVRSVSLGIWIGTGSRVEKGAENGLSHFIEHMVFRNPQSQCRRYRAFGGFNRRRAGCLHQQGTGELQHQGFGRTPPHRSRRLSDMVLNPVFREEDIEKEKGVILEEIKKRGRPAGIRAPRDVYRVTSGRGTAWARRTPEPARRSKSI